MSQPAAAFKILYIYVPSVSHNRLWDYEDISCQISCQYSWSVSIVLWSRSASKGGAGPERHTDGKKRRQRNQSLTVSTWPRVPSVFLFFFFKKYNCLGLNSWNSWSCKGCETQLTPLYKNGIVSSARECATCWGAYCGWVTPLSAVSQLGVQPQFCRHAAGWWLLFVCF